MGDYEWTRIVTVILAVIAIFQFLRFWKRTKEPGVFAPISWLLNIIFYSTFKFIVDGDLEYYNIAVVWNNIIFIHGIVMLIIGGYLFRDIKTWTYKH
jgi:hypothetical protein